MASTVVEIFKGEAAHFDADKTVGVIVPYRNQIATLRAAIESAARQAGLSHEACLTLQGICIDTVERYQGSQREYILYGFTVQHEYQMEFLTSSNFTENGVTIDRKLNVAMTRARRHLFLYGNAAMLVRNEVYQSLILFLKEKGACFSS